jgi:DNA ligase-1
MMAERLPSAEAIVKKLGTCSVEWKLDGFRCQIHTWNNRIEIFSRNLERTTSMFPDLVESARKQLAGSSVILDGEAVAVNPSTGEYYPFQVTVQRKRKYRAAEMAREFPLFLFVFDLLRLNGKADGVAARPGVSLYEKARRSTCRRHQIIHLIR